MLETTNDSRSFLDEFEEEGKTPIIKELDGTEEGVDLINTKLPTDDGIKEITTIDLEDEEPETKVEVKETKKEDKKSKEVEKVEPKEDEQDGFSYKAFLSHLNDEGVVSFEDREDLEDTPEIVYESVKRTIDDGIKSYKDSIPEKGKQLLEYLEKGGDINKFIQTLNRPLDLDSLDLSSEADQEKVMREYLRTQDYTNEEINETITDYKDGLLLDKQAKVAAKKLEKAFEKQNENLLRAQEQEAQQRAQETNRYIETISNTIDSSQTLAGLEISKTEKDAFRKYLLVRDKEGLTSYERELQVDPVKTQLELAYLKFKKYDFGKAKKEGKTEASKELNWKLKNNDKTVQGKSLKEIKDESTSLSAFDVFRAKYKG